MRPVTQLSDAFCLNCCKAIVAAVGERHRTAQGGDILLCSYCGYAMQLSENLVPHEPSTAALSYILSRLHRANAN